MITLYCPSCQCDVKVQIGRGEETIPVKGEPIAVQSEYAVCVECGEKIFDEKLDSENLEKAYRAYRKNRSLLFPEEIKRIREKYGLSQRALSKLLGWGEVTTHRYESGALQDKAHDEILRLIDDPRNMLQVFERNGDALPTAAAEKLGNDIQDLLCGEVEAQFQESLVTILSADGLSSANGYKKFDLYKMENMILFFADKLGGVYKTKMNKLLWYADFLCYKATSRSISGSRYQAYDLGPVPENYELIFGDLRLRNLIDVLEVVLEAKEGSKPSIGERIVARQQFNPSAFSETELKCLEYVVEKFRDFSATQIVDVSHREQAYSLTQRSDIISYTLADKLSISISE